MASKRSSIQFDENGAEITFDWSPIHGRLDRIDASEESVIVRAARVCYGNGYEDVSENKLNVLIPSLLKSRHMKPFDFAHMTWIIRTPIFVERQLRVYRTATILERSLRYCNPIEVKYYDQMSTGDALPFIRYTQLIGDGEPKEYARRVLPLSTFTEAVFSINVRNLLHLLEERLAPPAQEETRRYAQAMFKDFEKQFPYTSKTFKELHNDLIYEEK